MRTRLIGVWLAGSIVGATAQTAEQRDLLMLSTTVYTAVLTCPGGLDPDPTVTVAALMSAGGIEPEDVAQGGRWYGAVQQIVVDLAEELRGKSLDEACARLTDKYPRWIRRRAP